MLPDESLMKMSVLFYHSCINELISWEVRAVQGAPSIDKWPTLVAYHNLVLSKEQAGMERAIGVTSFTRGK